MAQGKRVARAEIKGNLICNIQLSLLFTGNCKKIWIEKHCQKKIVPHLQNFRERIHSPAFTFL